jgi:integrase/recombinase XerD
VTAIAPTLQAFFTERLANQKRASTHTVGAYRDTFHLLLGFAQDRTGKTPSRLDFDDVDAILIGAFLDHLEHERHNSVRTRNARLAAIHSMFRFAALAHPEHAALIQRVLAIPTKRFERTDVSFLGRDEIDALLAAPDRTRWVGRRDHALLVTAVQTGLRVSELVGLCCADINLDRGAHVQCAGKGRKQRATPLTAHTVSILRVWLQEHEARPEQPLFPTSRGRPLSTDAVALLVARHAATAARSCPTLTNKTVTPHVLRHSAAMSLLHAGVDATVISMWLGHESVETTQAYVHADLTIKERALARTTPPGTTPGRYRPPDALLAFLEAL